MTKVPLYKVKDQLSKYIDRAAKEEVVVTRHGKPAAVIIGFKDDDDWFDYRLENDPRFLARIEESRRQLREGRYTLLEELPK
jgi:prevent-host-death family protein